LSRFEWEKELSQKEAEELFSMAQGHIIEKIRYIVPWEGKIFEVDEFIRPRQGLVLAEVELEDENEKIPLPGWIGREVTGKKEFYNAYMAQNG
jgi:CYTH domain-containing protein